MAQTWKVGSLQKPSYTFSTIRPVPIGENHCLRFVIQGGTSIALGVSHFYFITVLHFSVLTGS